MSLRLACDAPECETSIQDPARAASWWRLERQGDGPFNTGALPLMPTIHLDAADAWDDPDDPDAIFVDDPVLHFCSTRCLLEWVTTGEALDA